MNGWVIAALVCAAGCLAVAVWALIERYRYKELFAAEKWGRTLDADRDKRAFKTLETERDALALQLDEALRPKTPPVVESTPKPARTRTNSRAKSPEKEK